jgi:hypothetical protein
VQDGGAPAAQAGKQARAQGAPINKEDAREGSHNLKLLLRAHGAAIERTDTAVAHRDLAALLARLPEAGHHLGLCAGGGGKRKEE